MADEPEGEPEAPYGNEASPPSKSSAPKDRQCIFCSQWFTSSSLGRHYDQWVRPQNPKAPDGVHDVRRIALMRGSVTRRPTRAERKNRRASPTPHGNRPISVQDGEASRTESPSMIDPPEDKFNVRFNRLNWSQTGVINNLPSKTESNSSREATGVMSNYEMAERRRLAEELEDGQAAEMALKEVLTSVQEAAARACRESLFNFDPFSLNFPSLCLRILLPPATLFSPTPFPSHDSWSITPPGEKQFEALQLAVDDRLTSIKRMKLYSQKAAASSSLGNSLFVNLDYDTDRLQRHIREAWSHWNRLSDLQRQEIWQLEALRMFAKMDESRRRGDITIDSLRREIENVLRELRCRDIEGQDHISANPPSSATHPVYAPGVSVKLSNDAVKALVNQIYNPTNLDYELLIETYKNIMKREKQYASMTSSNEPRNIIESHHLGKRPIDQREEPALPRPPPPPNQDHQREITLINKSPIDHSPAPRSDRMEEDTPAQPQPQPQPQTKPQ